MALGNLGKYSAMLQNMPNPNTGTHTGGLSHVLQQALLGYSAGQDQRADEAKRTRLADALRIGMGTPENNIAWNSPRLDGSGEMNTPIPAVPGDWSGMIGALGQDYPELSLQMMGQERNTAAAADAAEAARLQGIEDARSQFMFELENGPPQERQIIEGRDGLSYYTDTGEQVLANQVPTVAQGPSTASVMTGEDLGIPGDTNSYEVTSQDGVITNISNLGGSGTSIDIDMGADGAPPRNAAWDNVFDANWTTVEEAQASAAVLNGFAYDLRGMSETINSMSDDDFLQTGAGSEWGLTVAKWAEALGLPVSENVDNIELLKSISNRIAPAMRQEGSGSTSDVEFQAFMESLPHLSTTKAGNLAIIAHLNAYTKYANDMAAVRQQAVWNVSDDVMGYQAEVERLVQERFGGQTGYQTPELAAMLIPIEATSPGTAEDQANFDILLGAQ